MRRVPYRRVNSTAVDKALKGIHHFDAAFFEYICMTRVDLQGDHRTSGCGQAVAYVKGDSFVVAAVGDEDGERKAANLAWLSNWARIKRLVGNQRMRICWYEDEKPLNVARPMTGRWAARSVATAAPIDQPAERICRRSTSGR